MKKRSITEIPKEFFWNKKIETNELIINLILNFYMKKTLTLMLVLATISFAEAQESETKDRPFRIEAEPSAFIAHGYSLLASYGVNEDRSMSVGLYTLALDIPDFLKTKMFDSVATDDKLRMTFELAGSFRYKIPLFKNMESNPYVGIFIGYQTYKHTDFVSNNETKISNLFLTPQVGYEFYFFRQMLYFNPSFRLVYEFGKNSDYSNPLNLNDAGPEIKDWVWLPSFSIGIRL